MSSTNGDLENFLEVVHKVAGSVADGPAALTDARDALSSTGLLTLGQDTAQEDDALKWLTYTVRAAAQSSPSLAFVLAARYAADRALGEETEAREPTFVLSTDRSRPVAATALDPDTVVVLHVDTPNLRAVAWDEVSGSVAVEARSGLKAAQLVSLTIPDAGVAAPVGAPTTLTDWDLLTGAALVGLARKAVHATQAYVKERHQFGVPIASFTGLRALVAEMELKVDGVEALLDVSMERGARSESVSATAGRAATEICIDAIQAHGGYGYIEEYPVASLLRDALSLQARAGGRRLHVARIAERGLGPTGGARS